MAAQTLQLDSAMDARLEVLRQSLAQAEQARAKRFALYESYKKNETAKLIAKWSKDVRDRAKAESSERSSGDSGPETDAGLHEETGGSGAESNGAGLGEGEQRRDDSGRRDDQPNVRR